MPPRPLGLRLEGRIGKAHWVRIGIYDGDSFDSPDGDPTINRHGWRYQLDRDQGAFVIGEGGWALGPGVTAKLGGWLHTADFAGQGLGAGNHTGNHGIYALLDFMIVGEEGQPGAVQAFLRTGRAPADRNVVAWAWDGGLSWTGPWPGRPDDRLALGVAHAAMGSPLADRMAVEAPGEPRPDYERVLELSYHLAISEACTLQPDLQWVQHPGGSAARPDALVFMLRLSLSY